MGKRRMTSWDWLRAKPATTAVDLRGIVKVTPAAELLRRLEVRVTLFHVRYKGEPICQPPQPLLPSDRRAFLDLRHGGRGRKPLSKSRVKIDRPVWLVDVPLALELLGARHSHGRLCIRCAAALPLVLDRWFPVVHVHGASSNPQRSLCGRLASGAKIRPRGSTEITCPACSRLDSEFAERARRQKADSEATHRPSRSPYYAVCGRAITATSTAPDGTTPTCQRCAVHVPKAPRAARKKLKQVPESAAIGYKADPDAPPDPRQLRANARLAKQAATVERKAVAKARKKAKR